MDVLVTGAAGFIGYHVCRRLAQRGDRVLGVDNLNAYYDVELKRRRLAELAPLSNFGFAEVELAEAHALVSATKGREITHVIHLAAQANVRYALQNPQAYASSNVAGHLNVLEFCRHSGIVEHLIYASSSSVYGADNPVPFSEKDVTDRPGSLYAATKKADEMMSSVYSDLFAMRQTGLRFFSVYGPWGRPDMAYWLFTDAILQGRPIQVFNQGQMQRDFTYVDDVVAAVLAVADSGAGPEQHRIYNIGNSRPVGLLDMIRTLESILGVSAKIEFVPLRAGEMPVTYADTTRIRTELGFQPATRLDDGLRRFVEWFRWYHRLA